MNSLRSIDLTKVLFLDIETVPQHPSFEALDSDLRELWSLKAERIGQEDDSPETLYERAGIYAEFGKVVCISVGIFTHSSEGRQFRVRSFFGDDEPLLLREFGLMADSHFGKNDHLLCAHNGKEFDFPYIARRMVVHGIRIPNILDIAGRKPWEVRHLDTMELWKFGDRKNFTSLRLLTRILGIPTPKDDIDGKDVARVYHGQNDLGRIERYCKRDTVAVAQVLLRFRGEALLTEEQILER